MTTSTNAELCFGIEFDEGYEFPWDEEWEDIEDWWIYEICQFEEE